MWPKVTCYPFCPTGVSVLPHGWGKREHFTFFQINIYQKFWFIWWFRLFLFILCKTKYQSTKLHSCTCTGVVVIPFWKLSGPSCPTLLYVKNWHLVTTGSQKYFLVFFSVNAWSTRLGLSYLISLSSVLRFYGVT